VNKANTPKIASAPKGISRSTEPTIDFFFAFGSASVVEEERAGCGSTLAVVGRVRSVGWAAAGSGTTGFTPNLSCQSENFGRTSTLSMSKCPQLGHFSLSKPDQAFHLKCVFLWALCQEVPQLLHTHTHFASDSDSWQK